MRYLRRSLDEPNRDDKAHEQISLKEILEVLMEINSPNEAAQDPSLRLKILVDEPAFKAAGGSVEGRVDPRPQDLAAEPPGGQPPNGSAPDRRSGWRHVCRAPGLHRNHHGRQGAARQGRAGVPGVRPRDPAAERHRPELAEPELTGSRQHPSRSAAIRGRRRSASRAASAARPSAATSTSRTASRTPSRACSWATRP